MDFLKFVSEARTCRRFDQSREMGKAALRRLADCARLTPSAGNAQVLRYFAISDPAVRAKLFATLKWAAALPDWPGPAEGERPTGYLVILGPRDPDGITPHTAYIDLGIAAQTIQLAAWQEGIGACMFLSFNPSRISEILPVPDGLGILLVMALGYAREERRLASLPEDGSTKYYRDAQAVHYVPKRALKDVLLGEY